MVFKELLLYCKAYALKEAMDPSEKGVWEGICRAYSQKFHVALPIVMDMDPEHVMKHEFASQLEDVNFEKHIEKILDQIYTLEDPGYQNRKEEDLTEFIKQAEKEEEERIKKNTKKALLVKKHKEEENKPTSGSVNFDGLKGEED